MPESSCGMRSSSAVYKCTQCTFVYIAHVNVYLLSVNVVVFFLSIQRFNLFGLSVFRCQFPSKHRTVPRFDLKILLSILDTKTECRNQLIYLRFKYDTTDLQSNIVHSFQFCGVSSGVLENECAMLHMRAIVIKSPGALTTTTKNSIFFFLCLARSAFLLIFHSFTKKYVSI